jgi:hypothetical protein
MVQLVLLWAALLLMLGALQLLTGGAFGFAVVPLGEDFNWVYFLSHHADEPAQRAFWAYDGRNPLAPWWYLAVKPLILDWTYGIYVVRKLTDLLCALAVYSVVRGLGTPLQARLAGALTLLFTFSHVVGQINWTMLVALSLNLFALAAYLRFLESARQALPWYLLSLLLYQIALGTYALQASACLGIFLLARQRHPLRQAFVDLAPFLAVFGIFYLTWSTSGLIQTNTLSASLSLYDILAKALRSLARLIWDPVYLDLTQELSLLPTMAVVALLLSALAVALLLHRFVAAPEPDRPVAGRLLLLAGALFAGTLALEVTSSIWTPGTRSPMLQQGLQPLLLLAAVLALPRRVAQPLIVVLTFAAALLALAYNARQIRLSAELTRISASLRTILPTITKPTTFVLLDPVSSISPYNSDIFIKTLYRSPYVNLKVATPGPAVTTWSSYQDIVFGPDSSGLYAESTVGNHRFVIRDAPAWTPYENVILLRATPNGVARTYQANPADLPGRRLGFARPGPVDLSRTVVRREPLPLTTWRLEGALRLSDGSLELPASPPAPLGLVQHPVRLEADSTYEVVLEARASGPAPNFYADLYGPGYDLPAQDHVIANLTPEFQTIRFLLSSGPQPSTPAALRFINPSPATITIRAVQLSRIY